MDKNFKHIGYWNRHSDIELVEIEGLVYALNGWNGEKYTDCWVCGGEFYMDVIGINIFSIEPIFESIDDNAQIIKYIVRDEGEQ